MIKNSIIFLTALLAVYSIDAGMTPSPSACKNGYTIGCLHPIASYVTSQKKANQIRSFNQRRTQQEHILAIPTKKLPPVADTHKKIAETISNFNIEDVGSASSVSFNDFEKTMRTETDRTIASFVIEDMPKAIVRSVQRNGIRRTIPGIAAWEWMRSQRFGSKPPAM